MPVLVIIIGIILVVVNYRALKKNSNSFSNVFENKKDDFTEVDMKIGQIRKDMAESLLEIQQEILELKNNSKVDDNLNGQESFEKENDISYLLKSENGVINDIHFNSKTEQIKKLLDMGLDDNEICEKLSLGKGEVQLVKGLFKKEKK